MHCMLSLVKIEGASKLVLKYILIALVSRPPSRVKAFLLQEDILIQKYDFERKNWQSIVKITCYWQCIERQLRGDIGFSVIRFCWRGDSSPCLPELSPVDIVLGRHVGGVWQCLMLFQVSKTFLRSLNPTLLGMQVWEFFLEGMAEKAGHLRADWELGRHEPKKQLEILSMLF